MDIALKCVCCIPYFIQIILCRLTYKFIGNISFVGNPGGNSHLDSVAVNGRIILKHILKKHGSRLCSAFIWLCYGTTGRLS